MKHLIVIFLIEAFLTSCHPDSNGLNTRKEVSKYCDFDISQTDYRIDTLNSGVLTLVDRKYGYQIADRGNNYVHGYDTCYLKMRAYIFWMNDVKK